MNIFDRHNNIQTRNAKKMRDSGIELLKIIAIGLIVISHVVKTLRTSDNSYISYSDYVINLTFASANARDFILVLFSYFGAWGNSIFFICSAWFLQQSNKFNKQKWFFMLLEVWFISICILIVLYIIRHGDISLSLIIKSFLPTVFGNNWYMTCYLLFYPIHPLLNTIICKLDKKHLFRLSFVLFVLYFVCCFIKQDLFYSSDLIRWVALYFVIAYIQFYMKDFSNSTKKNVTLLFIGFLGYIGIAFVANYLGLRINSLNDKVLHWISNGNPFIIAISIAMFNLMKKKQFRSRLINYVSSLSLLIYLIHENLIIKIYVRPAMWNYVYVNYGYTHIIIWVAVLSIVVFVFSLLSALIYDLSIRILVRNIAAKLYLLIRKMYINFENRLLK